MPAPTGKHHVKSPYLILLLCGALVVGGCAPAALPAKSGRHRAAVAHLKEAAAESVPAGQRAVLYLMSAQAAASLLDGAGCAEPAREIYNQAAADLTVLLRSADQGRLWNRPLQLTAGGVTYQLRFAKPGRDGIWDAGCFTGMTRAAKIPNGDLDRRNLRTGVGGALVGNHSPSPQPPHVRPCGVNAAVTATLEFRGREVLLTLLDPSVRKTARVAGAERPLAADFSAPLAAYPQGSEFWNGISATLRVEKYMSETGLFMLRPFDPTRIPVIFVHGLASTPRMWRRIINELETDPEFRSRYQCWLFSYPTGNPPAYSALRLRQELASIERAYPHSRPFVLVGHSMGGLLSRMQVTTLTRDSWNVMGKDAAKQFFAKIKPGDIVDQSTRFQANPHVARVIFICTPHRGSNMALSGIGSFTAKRIALPTDLRERVAHSMGDSVAIVTGDPNRMPTSVSGLSPNNPSLKVLDHRPLQAPHHSIIGDRGKGDGRNSTDGVVDYWSSHLDSAQSECIVAGPHSACELPATLAEIRRILHLHLLNP
jgi:pimeloyl-ACP methyl ester carboxylesterase